MKYYILDLSPHNSLVKYLTEQGFAIFMISWKNPGPDDRDLGMEDYRTLGVMSALDAVNAVLPDRKVHAVGYCLGGTLLSIAAAAMARDGDERFATLTLLAAQTDFGRIPRRHDVGARLPRQPPNGWRVPDVALERPDLVAPRARLSARRASAGDRPDGVEHRCDPDALPHAFGISAQAVPRQRPCRGPVRGGGRPISLADVRAPIFAVGTERDHVAPWRSTYKILLQVESDVTYLLTVGGHNAGIVSEPGHHGRSFRVATKRLADHYVDPDAYYANAPVQEGSWWPRWVGWLTDRSGPPTTAPAMGAPQSGYPPLAEAPGLYVLED
jgi:polyhydroxyalkanoate synthase